MSVDEGLIAWVEEATEPLGRFSKRKMFGGAALYLDGVIFAITGFDDDLWFKSDAVFDAAGCQRISGYDKHGRERSMNYRRAPSEVHDDPEAMQRWAALALEAGWRGRKV